MAPFSLKTLLMVSYPITIVLEFVSSHSCFLVDHGDSIASEGKGEYMYVEGRVLSPEGKPIPDASIETWETDDTGISVLVNIR